MKIRKANGKDLRKRSRKSQLKVQEMAFMLMAVVIFFIIAGLFFVVVKYRGMYKTSAVIEKEKAVSLIAKLADTAEFSCGEPLCIDTDKLIVMQDRAAYDGFWPVVSLSVRKIGEQELVECTENNYPDCNLFEVYEETGNKEEVSTFVSLCRKEQEKGYWYDKCELGKLIAGIKIEQLEK